jgi:hypothetical protein
MGLSLRSRCQRRASAEHNHLLIITAELIALAGHRYSQQQPMPPNVTKSSAGQMRSVFQDEFDALPHHAKAGNGISLLIMVAVLGLLMAPAVQHRFVDNGDVTRRIMRVISAAMTAALGLFAFSLAINIFIALERALWFWFGAEWLAVMRSGGKEPMMADAPTSLIKKIDQLLTEVRVVLPGAQARCWAFNSR